MIILADIGNTHIKTAELQGTRFCDIKRFVSANEFFEYLQDKKCDIYISSVNEKLNAEIKKLIPNIIFLSYKDYPFDIKVDFPEKVGIDRLMNSLALWQKYKSSGIVVDIGTAITVDFINETGDFLGGHIVPGADLMLKSLNLFTDKLPQINFHVTDSLYGKNTEDAMKSGVFFMIQAYLKELKREFSQDYQYMLLTGGFFKYYGDFFREYEICDNLLFEGMFSLLPEA